VDLTLSEEDVSTAPAPLRSGFPFTVTAIIHNNADVAAVDVPLMVHISAEQDQIGYTSFLQVLTVTVPPSESLPVKVPVNWNFAGGEHQLWVQANRVPDAWQSQTPALPEADITDNFALLNVMVDPFDAYTSDLCSGRVDVEIGSADVMLAPDRQRVLVRVHNVGNNAVYHLPVIAAAGQVSGIAYTPAIPPCGGTSEVYVEVDGPLQTGEPLSIQVNPGDWPGGLAEDDYDNNQVVAVAGLMSEPGGPVAGSSDDYDFGIGPGDIGTPELWIVVVTVHNLGTRDADKVPILIENESGRKITDVIPLVQGNGLGVAATRVGYLWTPGGTLTFTVNPEDAQGAYPEAKRTNNVATFTLP
jgi:hypothetical protein